MRITRITQEEKEEGEGCLPGCRSSAKQGNRDRPPLAAPATSPRQGTWQKHGWRCDLALCQVLWDLLNTPQFSVRTTPDVLGVELFGGLKNVVALAAGFCEPWQQQPSLLNTAWHGYWYLVVRFTEKSAATVDESSI